MTQGAGEARRRWRDEEAVLSELEDLNEASMMAVDEFRAQAPMAALAEAEHKRLRARAVLSARARGVPVTLCLYEAEADDEVSAAYVERLTTMAVAEAIKERLRSIRANQEALRTAAASKRDMISGPGWSGRR